MSHALPYGTAPDESTSYEALVAASEAITSELRVRVPLLYYKRTLTLPVQEAQFIVSPVPIDTINTVALAEGNVVLERDSTATLALAIDGVRLAVDQATLTLGGDTTAFAQALVYQRRQDIILRLTSPVNYGAIALVDCVAGWGSRSPLRGVGSWPDALAAGATGFVWTSVAPAPRVGATVQWDDELMAVREVSSEGLVTLARALAGTAQAEHLTSSGLYQIVPSEGLAMETQTIAKRIADRNSNPGAGPAFDATGDPTPSLFRNSMRPLARYRPSRAIA